MLSARYPGPTLILGYSDVPAERVKPHLGRLAEALFRM